MTKQLDDTTLISESEFENFGSFIFLKKLAAGGMAEVFLARPASYLANGRLQVVKRILPHIANIPLFLEMFQAEIKVILGFNNPHTIQLHDFGEFNKQPYISMEYIEGKSLKDLISKYKERNQYIPIPLVLSLISQTAAGLSYAHTFVNQVTGEVVNAVHRDISPHNLIVSYGGNLKVIDFGIAKAMNSSVEQTQTGTLKGKIAYMAPEQFIGHELDARADLFSLGLVAWELLTLCRPFSKENDSDIVVLEKINHCDEQIVRPSQFNPAIPKEIDHLILKALRKNPSERFSSAKEFQLAVREVMIKYYPSYTYAENGKALVETFRNEIISEGQEIRDLNQKAQANLVDKLVHEYAPEDKSKTQISSNSGTLNFRLKNIEELLKQRTSARQYFFVFAVIACLIALKMNENSAIFSYINSFHNTSNLPTTRGDEVRKNTKVTKGKERRTAVVEEIKPQDPIDEIFGDRIFRKYSNAPLLQREPA